MKIVIDLQGAQGINRNRGIGRLSRALAKAMIERAGPHEPIILLNEAAPESSDKLMEEFSALLPRENIHFWHGLTNASAIGDAQSVARRRASEQIRAHCIAGLAADAVFLTSVVEGATDDTITNWPASLERPLHAATFYDAIPLMNPEQYLRGDWKPLAGWYFAQVQELRMCDGLLAISESARQEAIDYLHYDPRRVSNIRAGFDRAVFRPIKLTPEEKSAFLARHRLRDDFILFVGAGDARKNEPGLLRAYALLPEAMRRRHQLVIVGASYPERLQETASSYRVSEQDLNLIGHVSEADLPILYSLSAVFVMPSKHEGFGLPALEAMACGAAVIASNTTSLPEVVGREDALFDPNEPASIAQKLQASLSDMSFRQSLKDHGLSRAQEFTWDESARRSWEALKDLSESLKHSNTTTVTALPVKKPSLAYVTTFSQAIRGFSDDATDLLPDLARHYDITLVTDAARDGGLDRLRSIFPSVSNEQFDSKNRYDRVVYDFRTTNDNDQTLRSLMARHAGVAILHDTSLAPMILANYQRGGNKAELLADLFANHGWAAIAAVAPTPTDQAIKEWPCTLPIFQTTLGVVVHSKKAQADTTRHFGAIFDNCTEVLAHSRWSLPPCSKSKAREVLQLDGDAPIVCSIGALQVPQRAIAIMTIWRLAMQGQREARLVFVGPAQPEVQQSLVKLARQGGYSEQLIFTGRLEFDRYQLWLTAVDVALQLESNSSADAVDAVVDTISAGIPTITYPNILDFSGIPHSCAVVVNDDSRESDIANTLRDVLADANGRILISNTALSFTRSGLSPFILARAFHAIVEKAYTQTEAARLQAVLPAIPEGSDISAARALAESFRLPEPRRLMLAVSGGGPRAAKRRADYPWLAETLATPRDGWFVEIVNLDNKTLRYNRAVPMAVLGIAGAPLADVPVLGSLHDILLLLEKDDYKMPDGIAELKRLRRRGMQIVTLLSGDEDESDGELLSVVDRAVCFPSLDKREMESRLKRLELRRAKPLTISLLHVENGLQVENDAVEAMTCIDTMNSPGGE
jgi:glycosyltransferase involved in cell wall biosynthesis